MEHKDPTNLYRQLLDAHGPTARGVGWSSLQAQWRRFDVAFEGWEFHHPFTLLDVGCGVGELLEWMSARRPDLRAHLDYIGIDTNERVIDAAVDRNGAHATRFQVADVREFGGNGFDMVLGSGVLSYYDFPEQLELVEAMWHKAGSRMVFNVKRPSHMNDAMMLLTQQTAVGAWSMRSDYGFQEITYRLSRTMWDKVENEMGM